MDYEQDENNPQWTVVHDDNLPLASLNEDNCVVSARLQETAFNHPSVLLKKKFA